MEVLTDVGSEPQAGQVPVGHCFYFEHSIMMRLSEHINPDNDENIYVMQVKGSHIHEISFLQPVIYLGEADFVLGRGQWNDRDY